MSYIQVFLVFPDPVLARFCGVKDPYCGLCLLPDLTREMLFVPVVVASSSSSSSSKCKVLIAPTMSISLVGSINSLSSDSVELVQLAEVFSH